jgi:diguanylate cyclase (GGDEF)-like protein
MNSREPLASESLESSASPNERALAGMSRIDRRGWWLWAFAISLNILLAVGMLAFAFPVFSGLAKFDASALHHLAAVTCVWVVIFDFYIVWAQGRINLSRREFADNLFKLAVLDPVTNMFNRRYVMHRLDEEIARSQRFGSPLTVIVFDLNSFKQINDQHGHAAGDLALKTFGDQLRRATRGSDVVARFGGDEFLAVLPDCDKRQIQYVLYRLLGLRADAKQAKVEIRYSAGWADYMVGESAYDMLRRADEMLYAN